LRATRWALHGTFELDLHSRIDYDPGSAITEQDRYPVYWVAPVASSKLASQACISSD